LVSIGRPRPPPAGDQHIDPAPFGDDPRRHRLDGIAVGDVELNAEGRAAGSLDFGDRAVRGHVLGLRIELRVGAQVQVRDGNLGAEFGETAGIGTAQAARRTGDDRNLAVELAHRVPPGKRHATIPPKRRHSGRGCR
jgi:hypothetical protein